MAIIANPSAARVTEELGFTPNVIQPGQHLGSSPQLGCGKWLRSLTMGTLRISAIPGSVVGPPWQAPENGYVRRLPGEGLERLRSLRTRGPVVLP